MQGSIFSSIPGFCPLDVGNPPYPLAVVTTRDVSKPPDVPRGAKSDLFWKHCLHLSLAVNPVPYSCYAFNRYYFHSHLIAAVTEVFKG